MSVLDDIRSALATIDEHRRTIICRPGTGEQIRQLVDEHMLSGLIDVLESPYLSEQTTLLIVKSPRRLQP